MARVVALRAKLKPELAAQKVNLTYLAFIARATVDTILDYPWINGELRGQSIVTRPFVNLGIAVALDDGKGLIVPVIRNAQDLNLTGTARAIQDLAERARTKKLLPDDVQGGTFTITNPGELRHVPRDADHQPAAVGDPRHVRAREAAMGRPGRARQRRHRDPAAHEPHAHVRPPARRRRVRGHVPSRPPPPARELGRGGVLTVTQRIVPFIGYEDAAGAIEWLERAFGFVENRGARHEEAGTIGHAELSLDEATVYLSTPDGYASPKSLRETSELARRAYDNPWVIDGQFVRGRRHRRAPRPRAFCRRDHPARARGAGDRLSHLHGRGPGGAPVDVRRGARERSVTPLQGRCLCGGVRFEVTEPFVRVSQCHCDVLQGHLGWIRHRQRPRARQRDPRARRQKSSSLVHTRGRLGEVVLLRLRVESVRRRVARVRDVEREAQRASGPTTIASPRRTRSSARWPHGRSSPTTASRGRVRGAQRATYRLVDGPERSRRV